MTKVFNELISKTTKHILKDGFESKNMKIDDLLKHLTCKLEEELKIQFETTDIIKQIADETIQEAFATAFTQKVIERLENNKLVK